MYLTSNLAFKYQKMTLWPMMSPLRSPDMCMLQCKVTLQNLSVFLYAHCLSDYAPVTLAQIKDLIAVPSSCRLQGGRPVFREWQEAMYMVTE